METDVWLTLLDVTSREGKGGLQAKIHIKKVTQPRIKRFLWKTFKPKVEERVLICDNWHSRTGHFHYCTYNCPESSVGMEYNDGWCYLDTTPTEKHPFYPIRRDRIRELIDQWFEAKGIEADGEWIDRY